MLRFRSVRQELNPHKEELKAASKKLEAWSHALERSKMDRCFISEIRPHEQQLRHTLSNVSSWRTDILKSWQNNSKLAEQARDAISEIDNFCSQLYSVAKESFSSHCSSGEDAIVAIGQAALDAQIGSVKALLSVARESKTAMERLMSQFRRIH
jgi:uncharacterized protein (DUF3084 family)